MNKYYVNFYAYEKDLDGGSPGHAYVGFVQKLAGSTLSSRKFGFYPAREITKEEAIAGNEKGRINEDDGTPFIVEYVNEVSFEKYSSAMNTLNQWQNTSTYYKILKNDCISFSEEIARAIGLSTPARKGINLTPENFVKEIRFEHLNYLKALFKA